MEVSVFIFQQWVEVTPENIRIRKKLLKENERKRSGTNRG